MSGALVREWRDFRCGVGDGGGRPCENRSRDSIYMATSQGTKRTAQQPLEARKEAEDRFSLRISSQEEPTLPTP